MTAQAWQQTLERIQAEARQLTPGQVLLTLVSAPLFILGWLAAKIVQVLWLAIAWSWTAGLVGWLQAGGHDGRKPPQVPL